MIYLIYFTIAFVAAFWAVTILGSYWIERHPRRRHG